MQRQPVFVLAGFLDRGESFAVRVLDHEDFLGAGVVDVADACPDRLPAQGPGRGATAVAADQLRNPSPMGRTVTACKSPTVAIVFTFLQVIGRLRAVLPGRIRNCGKENLLFVDGLAVVGAGPGVGRGVWFWWRSCHASWGWWKLGLVRYSRVAHAI